LGRVLEDQRSVHVACSPSQAFRPIRRIGGATGWYYGNWLWRLRGLVDVLVGGRGLRPGRRHDDDLQEGDPVDCWEVESLEPGRRLRLAATMKLPGQAWLQFGVEANGGGSTIRQTATFLPRGLAGLVYWYALYPIHMVMFGGMLRSIAMAAENHPPQPAAADQGPEGGEG
jgi:hypothetical protein